MLFFAEYLSHTLAYVSQDGGRMRELSVRYLGCNSCSLIKVGNYYVNLGIK